MCVCVSGTQQILPSPHSPTIFPLKYQQYLYIVNFKNNSCLFSFPLLVTIHQSIGWLYLEEENWMQSRKVEARVEPWFCASLPLPLQFKGQLFHETHSDWLNTFCETHNLYLPSSFHFCNPYDTFLIWYIMLMLSLRSGDNICFSKRVHWAEHCFVPWECSLCPTLVYSDGLSQQCWVLLEALWDAPGVSWWVGKEYESQAGSSEALWSLILVIGEFCLGQQSLNNDILRLMWNLRSPIFITSSLFYNLILFCFVPALKLV